MTANLSENQVLSDTLEKLDTDLTHSGQRRPPIDSASGSPSSGASESFGCFGTCGSLGCFGTCGSFECLLGHDFRLLLELFRLIVSSQRIDDGLEFAIHHLDQLVERKANAVIGYAVLRKVVRADLFAAIAAANHGLAFFCQGLLLLFHFDFVETRAQDAHGLFTILDLRLLVLAAYDRVRRQVRDSYCRVGGIHRLATRSRGTKRIDPNIFKLDLDVYILGFRKHRHGNGRGMYTTLLLGLRHTLNSMDTALILHARKDAFTFDDGNDFLKSTHSRFGGGKHFDLPSLRFRIAVVHPEHLGGEKRCFVTTGSGANFKDDVLLVVRILGQQQHFQFFAHAGDALFQAHQLFLRIGPQLGILLVGEDYLALVNAALQILVLPIPFYDFGNLTVRLGGLLEFARIIHNVGRG